MQYRSTINHIIVSLRTLLTLFLFAPVWMRVATVLAMAVIIMSASFYLPMRQGNQLINRIISRNGHIRISYNHPRWLYILDDNTYHPWFDHIASIAWNDDTINNKDVDDILVFTDISALEINISNVSPEAANKLSEFRNLESLTLYGNGRAIEHQWFSSIPTLQDLTLHRIPVSKRMWKSIAATPKLTDLLIVSASVNSDAVSNDCLERMWCYDVALQQHDGNNFCSLESLNYLQINKCRTTSGFWRALSKHKSLKRLDINFMESDSEMMNSIGSSGSLEHLHLHHILDIGSNDLAGLIDLNQLKTLDITDSKVREDHSLFFIAELKSLERVSLAGTNVEDIIADALAECSKLKYLDLKSTSLSDVGLEKLQMMPTIEYLDVRYTSVTDQGLSDFQRSRIRASLQLPTIKH